jgi:hypothetical protein
MLLEQDGIHPEPLGRAERGRQLFVSAKAAAIPREYARALTWESQRRIERYAASAAQAAAGAPRAATEVWSSA